MKMQLKRKQIACFLWLFVSVSPSLLSQPNFQQRQPERSTRSEISRPQIQRRTRTRQDPQNPRVTAPDHSEPGDFERLCFHLGPITRNLPSPHPLSVPPSWLRSIARAFGGGGRENEEESPTSLPENYYEVRGPDGNPCPARVDFTCQGEQRGSQNFPTGEGELTISTDCPAWSNTNVSGRCTSGSYRNFYSSSLRMEGRRHVLLAGNDPLANDPDIEDGTLVVEVLNQEGQMVPADVEVRRPGGTHTIRLFGALTGEGQIALDDGEYEVKAIHRTTQWTGSRRVSVSGGRTYRYVVRLDTAPVYTATVTVTPASVYRDPQQDFPQVSGELCDANDNFVSASGELKVLGIERPHYAIFEVTDGRFRLYGLREGRYILRFDDGDREGSQLLKIPLKTFMRWE